MSIFFPMAVKRRSVEIEVCLSEQSHHALSLWHNFAYWNIWDMPLGSTRPGATKSHGARFDQSSGTRCRIHPFAGMRQLH